jgi:DUF3052 family protein
MGLEAATSVSFNGRRSAGKALLETNQLIFRGEFRLLIGFKEIEGLDAEDGVLVVRFPAGEARFELGAAAPKWAARIRNPPGRLAKLGVKAGIKVGLAGAIEPELLEELAVAGAELLPEETEETADLFFYAVQDPADLDLIPFIKGRINEAGAIWVVAPKGKGSPVKEAELLSAGRAAGLVDTKVVAFSATHTALKFMIPREQREHTRTGAKPAPA